jgi:two-component system, response regulator PdtaR
MSAGPGIVDAQLREGNGVSAVDQILGTGFVPHLFISGDIKTILAGRPGAVAIEKPFRESELVEAIRRALGNRLIIA